MPDLHVTVDQLASRWGISERRVQQLAQNGTIPKGKRGQYPYIACCEAYIRFLQEASRSRRDDDNKLNPIQQADLRLKLAKAEEQEQRNRLATGEYIAVIDIKPVLQEAFATFKSSLLNLSASLPLRVAGKTDLKAIRAIVEEAINESLSHIANIKLSIIDAAPDAGAVESAGPTTEADSEPMGGDEPSTDD